jgi:hypothetical protein
MPGWADKRAKSIEPMGLNFRQSQFDNSAPDDKPESR